MGYRQKPIKAKSKFNRLKNSVFGHTGSSGLHRTWWLAPPLGPATSTTHGLSPKLRPAPLEGCCCLSGHPMGTGISKCRGLLLYLDYTFTNSLSERSIEGSCCIWATPSLTASPRGLLRNSDLAIVPSLNFSSQPFNPGPSTAPKAAPSPVASPDLSSGTLALPHRAKPHPLSPILDTFKPVPITKFGCQHKLQPPPSLDRSLPSQLTLYPGLLSWAVSEEQRFHFSGSQLKHPTASSSVFKGPQTSS